MTTERTIQLIDVQQIVPGDNGSGHQDRTVFDAGSLAELAGSIAAHGLLQPITLRPVGESELFCIVAGERRFRACELLGWLEIPAIVADVTADEAAALMLAENTSREDLNPVDEANAYQVRIDRLGWTVADCAKAAGVSEARVLFRLKLLKLRPDLLELVRTGNLPLGYAQIIADGNLDVNRQLLALRALRNSPSPTPGWFRRQVGELLTQQAQASIFDDGPLFGGLDFSEPAQHAFVIEPPTPATVTPPATGGTPREIVAGQIGFWQQAAEAWADLGRPFKRQECEAAVQALGFVFATL
jgi:ParB/RepB/Spo0J family partition protein